jgi:gamma-glutamylputrescine oxidase
MMSIWEKETFFAPQDVLIIGSGFVGLWSAFYIKKKHPKAKVTIVDGGLIPTGASTRNAGFACFGSLSELMYDIQEMGVDKTLALVEMRYEGLQKIQKHFGKHTIDFELCGGYELFNAMDGISTQKLKEDIDYLNSLVKNITSSKHTYKLVDNKIDTFGFAGISHLVKNNFEGYLHSGKLLKQLLQTVQAMGVQVLNNIDIKGFENVGDGCEVFTDRGFNFQAQQILICTNAFAKSLLPEEDIIPAHP